MDGGDWTQAVNDVIGFACAQFPQFDPQEVREAVEEILPAAQDTFDRLGHFCSGDTCRCRAETIVQIRAFVEARFLDIESVGAQVFAVQRFKQYLDERS